MQLAGIATAVLSLLKNIRPLFYFRVWPFKYVMHHIISNSGRSPGEVGEVLFHQKWSNDQII